MRRVDVYFAALQEALLKLPGVTDVRTMPLTSSLLVVSDPEIGQQVIGRYALDHELFELQPRGTWPSKVLDTLRAGATKLDRRLRTADGERYDKRTLILLLLLVLGLKQMREGQIMAPAFNLFWNAYMVFEAMGANEASATPIPESTAGDGFD